MSTWSIAEARENTMLSAKSAGRLNAEVAKSALFEESAVRKPFLPFFLSTSSFLAPEHTQLELLADGDSWRTPLLSDEPTRRSGVWRLAFDAPNEQEQDSSARENSIRVTLLARKYVSKERFSPEESARLAIVTERVRQLIPAVTANEFEALADALARVKDLTLVNSEIRGALGIRQGTRD